MLHKPYTAWCAEQSPGAPASWMTNEELGIEDQMETSVSPRTNITGEHNWDPLETGSAYLNLNMNETKHEPSGHLHVVHPKTSKVSIDKANGEKKPSPDQAKQILGDRWERDGASLTQKEAEDQDRGTVGDMKRQIVQKFQGETLSLIHI